MAMISAEVRYTPLLDSLLSVRSSTRSGVFARDVAA